MKNKKILFLFSLIFINFIHIIPIPISASMPFPISLDGNDQIDTYFDNYGNPSQDGLSWNTAYIIELESLTNSELKIIATNRYLIIRNCSFDNTNFRFYNCQNIKFYGNLIRNYDMGLFLEACSDVFVESNRFENCKMGLALSKSNNISINDNLFQNNIEYGIFFSETNECLIKNNRFIENPNGIYIRYFTEYRLIGGELTLVKFYCYHNIFALNVFWKNTVQALDDGNNTKWNQNEKGNLWGDYLDNYPDAEDNGINIWSEPYRVYGESNQFSYKFDYFPLIEYKGYSTYQNESTNQTTNETTPTGNDLTVFEWIFYGISLSGGSAILIYLIVKTVKSRKEEIEIN